MYTFPEFNNFFLQYPNTLNLLSLAQSFQKSKDFCKLEGIPVRSAIDDFLHLFTNFLPNNVENWKCKSISYGEIRNLE